MTQAQEFLKRSKEIGDVDPRSGAFQGILYGVIRDDAVESYFSPGDGDSFLFRDGSMICCQFGDISDGLPTRGWALEIYIMDSEEFIAKKRKHAEHEKGLRESQHDDEQAENGFEGEEPERHD
jgi:hypothetical protein